MLDLVKTVFESHGIMSTDKRKGFTPHLTVAKLSKDRRHSIKNISEDLYSDCTIIRGEDKIEQVELLSMTEKKDETGYYYCFAREYFIDSSIS